MIRAGVCVFEEGEWHIAMVFERRFFVNWYTYEYLYDFVDIHTTCMVAKS